MAIPRKSIFLVPNVRCESRLRTKVPAAATRFGPLLKRARALQRALQRDGVLGEAWLRTWLLMLVVVGALLALGVEQLLLGT